MGHVNTTFGVCKELVNEGHHVIYYTSPKLVEHVKNNTGADVRVSVV